MSARPNLAINLDELISLRHHLHAHPELSRQEFQTSAYLQQYLTDHLKPDEIIRLAGAGFAAVYNGKKPGKTVLIRCELDALPIHETNENLPYKSVFDGIGHKCGHDGHMSILIGIAQIFSQNRPDTGRVVLLFQPDEETGTGARECSTHRNFQEFITPDFAFALHNFPGAPRGQIICKPNTFMAAVKCAALKFHGKETHSGMPEKGTSPAFAIAEITNISKDIQKKFNTDHGFALIVPVHYQMGVSSSGVAPGYGEAYYTLRAENSETEQEMWNEFHSAVKQICTKYGLELEIEIIEEFETTNNDPDCVKMIEHAANENGYEYLSLTEPFRAGEDFGEITKRYKGAIFGIGAGEHHPELHNPDYDFPDEIIPHGISMFLNLIRQVLD